MFKRKKIVTLCAATLAGVSAMTSLVPMVTFADATKEGQTTVAYEGAPKPAEWGLSVPATVKLDKDTTDTTHEKWGQAKMEIVNEDGSSFTDAAKAHTFNVSGTFNKVNPGYEKSGVLFDEDGVARANLNVGVQEQGVAEPTTLGTTSVEAAPLTNIEFSSLTDGSKSLSRFVQFKLYSGTANWKSMNLSNTISWTATEKTS